VRNISNRAKNVLLIFKLYWTMNAQSLKKLSVIKEIWFWLPSGYRWTERSQPRTGL